MNADRIIQDLGEKIKQLTISEAILKGQLAEAQQEINVLNNMINEKDMEIAIIAHDAKKELMVQFCIAYCGVLAKHHICATKATGKMVSDATGLEIEQLLPGRQGGIDQIMSRIAYNEIDILLYFRDNNTTADFNELLTDSGLVRECDIHNTPVATNIATAETIICALERGDLDWRQFVNPKSEYNRHRREASMLPKWKKQTERK